MKTTKSPNWQSVPQAAEVFNQDQTEIDPNAFRLHVTRTVTEHISLSPSTNGIATIGQTIDGYLMDIAKEDGVASFVELEIPREAWQIYASGLKREMK